MLLTRLRQPIITSSLCYKRRIDMKGRTVINQAGAAVVVADWSASHCQTLTCPVPSPVKKILGPPCIDRISCFAYIFPLSENLIL
ncbi:hypothetical protein HanRHA438_Chr13g0601641 [Helianthus annuus]|nr:hypothetical protein HanIR_Chr13g0643211 [Helianthus annuus]KAJ0858494.1 hypothetical protein HanRHA438_Chr13g0601641 [Helianthus annuus]